LDTLQKEHQKKLSRPITVRQLNRIYDNLNDLVERDYSHIEFEKPSQPEFWDHVEWIAGMSSVRARDAIHCATAYGDLSDLIVTEIGPSLPLQSAFLSGFGFRYPCREILILC